MLKDFSSLWVIPDVSLVDISLCIKRGYINRRYLSIIPVSSHIILAKMANEAINELQDILARAKIRDKSITFGKIDILNRYFFVTKR